MKLSHNYPESDVARDGYFSRLGYVDAQYSYVLSYADNLKYCLEANANQNISCLIVPPKLSAHANNVGGLLISSSPRDAFYDLHFRFIQESLYSLPFEPGIGSNCKSTYSS